MNDKAPLNRGFFCALLCERFSPQRTPEGKLLKLLRYSVVKIEALRALKSLRHTVIA